MKKAFLGLMLVVACLAGLPAYAATYTYDVDYTFAFTTTNKTGSITGFITTNCDSCVLTRAIFCRGHSRQATAQAAAPQIRRSGISTTDYMLEATPTGIFTVSNATNGASIRFCSDIAGDGEDCFPGAGLDVYNLDHGGAMPPTWYIAWVENSGAEGTFVDRCRHGFFS